MSRPGLRPNSSQQEMQSIQQNQSTSDGDAVHGGRKEGDNNTETQLAVMHLQKLFDEFIISKPKLNEYERDTKLYHMLPLYCNVFKKVNDVKDAILKDTSISNRNWEFQNVLCYEFSNLLTREIKKRASNQNTEKASKAIANFLKPRNADTNNESGSGWLLLTAISLIANRNWDTSLHEIMINASLPSTLVRCIYLFLDLPEQHSEYYTLHDDSNGPELESSLLLFNCISQILIELCSYPLAAEELIRMDDLTLLFSTVTTQYTPCNTKWRSLARNVLLVIGRHGLNATILEYVHGKGCIALSVDNMQRSMILVPADTVEILQSICTFLHHSADVSQILLNDFKQCHGYQFLTDFLIGLDQDKKNVKVDRDICIEKVLSTLISIIVSLCSCSYLDSTQLSSWQDDSVTQRVLHGFRMPKVPSKKSCVRNVNAFQVLQTSFLRSTNDLLCCIILDAIMQIYQNDDANYFILESQNTINCFAEKIHKKNDPVQTKFFELIEFIVYSINFFPPRELITLSVLLKSNNMIATSIKSIRTLLNILRHNSAFIDVFREVGILEVFVICMKRYKDFLEMSIDMKTLQLQADQEKNEATQVASDEEDILGCLVLEALGQLITGNASNTAVFKSSGGSKCIYDLIKFNRWKNEILKIVRELVSTVGGEDDMLNLLKTINAFSEFSKTSITIRINVLQLVIECLKDSHRTRAHFRKVGGFIYVLNALELLKDRFVTKNSLDEPAKENVWLLRAVCQTLTAAMRFEPANAKYFQNEIAETLFYQTIRDLGCFSNNITFKPHAQNADCGANHAGCTSGMNNANIDSHLLLAYKVIFAKNITESCNDAMQSEEPVEIGASLPSILKSICIIYRVLYDVVLDGFDKRQPCELQQYSQFKYCASKTVNVETPISIASNKKVIIHEMAPTITSVSKDLSTDYLIVHPSVIICMLKLLPSIEEPCLSDDCNATVRWKSSSCNTVTLQYFLAEVIKSLVRSERNQQIMCDHEFNHCLLNISREVFIDEQHPLHTSLEYIFERLAVQALMPNTLRTFLRLNLPSRNEPLNENLRKMAANPVPLTRVKTLVSITTPRDFRLHGPTTPPSFVEMDMSTEGFACLFFPNIAPNQVGTVHSSPQRHHNDLGRIKMVNADRMKSRRIDNDTGINGLTSGSSNAPPDISNVGGVGSGDRSFPAINGLTFSSWFCIESYPSREDNHPIRLLHIIRTADGTQENDMVVFGVLILAPDKSLLVTTQETPFTQDNYNYFNKELLSPVSCSAIIQECQWHHVVVTVNKVFSKSSMLSVYFDGRLIHTQKTYPIVKGPTVDKNVGSSLHAFIGTPPLWRQYSKLIWKQGVCHLIDDTFDASTVSRVYKLGPHYVGSFQDTRLKDSEDIHSLILENRVAFGVNPKAYSHMTLLKIRKVYNRTDAKTIGKQLGMSSHENATPILILHNSAVHLTGPARTLGGVLIGYLGIRKFNPFPVSMTLNTIGGCSVLLGLVAMSQDVESLYAAIKAMTCILKTNEAAREEMNNYRYYQTLGMLFKRKKYLLNSHILHLTFNIVGTVHTGYENSSIPNITAFQDLLCDFDIWLDKSNDLIRSLLEHLLELVVESNAKTTNIRILQDLQCLSKLLFVIEYISEENALKAGSSLLRVLLGHHLKSNELLLFGQYVINCIPEQHHLKCDTSQREQLPNRFLRILHDLHFNSNNTVNLRLCEEVTRVLGLDWILLLMQPQLDSSTMIWAMRILVVHLSTETIRARFRDRTKHSENEGYLKNTGMVTKSRNAILLPSTIRQSEDGLSSSVASTEASHKNDTPEIVMQQTSILMGFPYLEWLLLHRSDIPEVYSLLIALIVGHPVKSTILPSKCQSLEAIWSFIWTSREVGTIETNVSQTRIIPFCSEAICIILSLIRKILHNNQAGKIWDDCETYDSPKTWLQSYSVDIVKLLMSLYRHLPDFASIAMSPNVIASLISTLYAPSFAIKPTLSPTSSSTSFSVMEKETISSDGDQLLSNEHPTSSKSLEYSPDDSPCLKEIRELTMDFLLTLVVDSLPIESTANIPPVIDSILELCSPYNNISEEQRKHYLSKIIHLLIPRLLSCKIFEPPTVLNITLTTVQSGHVLDNVFYITGRIVDKLWQRMLDLDGREVFDYCVGMILQTKQCASIPALNRVGSTISIYSIGSLESLYRSLNRCILYLLAYPPDPKDNTSLAEVLQLLITNRLLVFGACNHDPDFIGCLTYCLLQLHEDELGVDNGAQRIALVAPITHASGSSSIWYMDDLLNKCDTVDNAKEVDFPSREQTSDLQSVLTMLSFRVWEELYICKKPVIEEIFKVTLIQPARNARAPDMKRTKQQVFEMALKHWLAYLAVERRTVSRTQYDGPNNIQSKIQKVTGGLTRLTSRAKLKKDSNQKRLRPDDLGDVLIEKLNSVKLTLVREYWDFRLTQHNYTCAHTKRYVYEDWLQTEGELIRERAIWGPECSDSFTKWVLDNTEGPYRMRKKMLKNEVFHIHYPPREALQTNASSDHQQQRQLKCRVAISHDSAKYADVMRQYQCMFSEHFEHEGNVSKERLTGSEVTKNNLEFPKSPRDEKDLEGDCLENEEGLCSSLPDNQALLRLLEENEKVSHIFRSARIQGLDTFEGLFLIGRQCCYIVDGFTLLRNREIRDIDTLPKENYEPIIPCTAPAETQTFRNIRRCSKILYEDIREIQKRRYLLQPIALEMFCCDGQNYLISFPCKVRNKVFQKLTSMATQIADKAHLSVAGQKRAANVEQYTGLLSSLIGEISVTQRWVQGEISNFQYLMHLNSLAGRSYNDLMQYPVFPWILSNYDSDTLNLNDENNFRDLSKPMGAQSQERLEQFQKRFKDWDDPLGETPPYHYGTHYSSAMIVCAYLVRLEPFAQHFLRLQGGHFDLADRMFHSIKEAWYSASKQNMADVKELIPEFFYLPEFLENSNSFDLGTKQNGEMLNDVILPVWAKNDTREFIRMHREALECDYVSRQLHLWIDLIFGYKQQGQASVEAVNVFHHLFYEGNVDIYNIDDPLKKNAAIGFINNFGQIPKQLFRKAHPPKRMAQSKYANKLGNVSPLIPPLSSLGGMTANNNEKLFFYHLNDLTPSAQPIKEVSGPVGQIVQQDRCILAVEQNKILVPTSYNQYVAWGFADHSIRVGTYDTDRVSFVCENIHQCGEILSCTSPGAKQLILGGTSSILLVCSFDTKRKKIIHKKSLFGHTDAVTALASSTAYNIIVSGSRDRSAIIWDLCRLSYVRQLNGHAGVVGAVSINELTGDIATCSGTRLYIWSINGVQLAVVNTSTGSSDRMQQILCTSFSSTKEWDTHNVIITGSTDGVVRMWSMDFVEDTKGTKENKDHKMTKTKPGDDFSNSTQYYGTDNNRWNRKLLLRKELTTHTAYDRKNNSEPASVTALAISKDHQCVYIGDARGRIFAWTVTESVLSRGVNMMSGRLGTTEGMGSLLHQFSMDRNAE
ncbi:WD repeat and FYVE domain-containing protein 3 [Anopheles bellator]|uniref:WD repeat and FYVE domain-containing protein 3 n=1 Tax=Anopheles bellator TaxID=139047 RepID=UPI0026473BB1|nr:WD repeat and FYVE domain-containing protein 3 [Anopheles bellator]